MAGKAKQAGSASTATTAAASGNAAAQSKPEVVGVEAQTESGSDRITLRQPYIDNGHRELGKNAVIMLGHGPGEIDPDRAAYLIDEGMAVYGDDPVGLKRVR